MRARRAANARRSAGPTGPDRAKVPAKARGQVTSTPSRVKGRAKRPDLRAGEAQRDPDQGAARRNLGDQGLGDLRLLPARRGHEAALVAAGHEETGAGDEPPAEVAPLQPAPEMLRVDDPDARGDHREVVDVGAPVGDGPIVQHHAVPADGLVEPVADTLLTGGAAAPGLGGRLRTGEEPDHRRQRAEDRPPAGLVPGLAPLVLGPRRGAGPSPSACGFLCLPSSRSSWSLEGER